MSEVAHLPVFITLAMWAAFLLPMNVAIMALMESVMRNMRPRIRFPQGRNWLTTILSAWIVSNAALLFFLVWDSVFPSPSTHLSVIASGLTILPLAEFLCMRHLLLGWKLGTVTSAMVSIWTCWTLVALFVITGGVCLTLSALQIVLVFITLAFALAIDSPELRRVKGVQSSDADHEQALERIGRAYRRQRLLELGMLALVLMLIPMLVEIAMY